jgi:hypothetical protein
VNRAQSFTRMIARLRRTALTLHEVEAIALEIAGLADCEVVMAPNTTTRVNHSLSSLWLHVI